MLRCVFSAVLTRVFQSSVTRRGTAKHQGVVTEGGHRLGNGGHSPRNAFWGGGIPPQAYPALSVIDATLAIFR